jgi:hypothetical protein
MNEMTINSVLFVKRTNEPITPQNISKCLDIQTLQGSPLNGLFNSLKSVWCPTLLDNNANTDKLPPRIKQLLAELESTLSNTIRSDNIISSKTGQVDVDFYGISTKSFLLVILNCRFIPQMMK